MNIQSKYPTTPDEFLRWNEGREGKREFVNGKAVEMMINMTLHHWRLCNRLVRQLTNQLGDERYDIGGPDFGVRTGDGIRFPDVMIVPSSSNGKALATASPLLLAEILSPSSMTDDFGPKARDYLLVESLENYLVVSQDEFRVWLWSRDADRQWLKPEMIEADSFGLHLGGALVRISMTELYAGIAERSDGS